MSKSSSTAPTWFSRIPFFSSSSNQPQSQLPTSTSPSTSPLQSRSTTPTIHSLKTKTKPRPFSLISLPPVTYLSSTPNNRGTYSTIIISPPEAHRSSSAYMSGALGSHHEETIQEGDENGNPFLDPVRGRGRSWSGSRSEEEGEGEAMMYELDSGADAGISMSRSDSGSGSEGDEIRHELESGADAGVGRSRSMRGIWNEVSNNQHCSPVDRQADLEAGRLSIVDEKGMAMEVEKRVKRRCWGVPTSAWILGGVLLLCLGLFVVVAVVSKNEDSQAF